MSSAITPEKKSYALVLPKLEAKNYQHWIGVLDDLVFAEARVPTADQLTNIVMVKAAYFVSAATRPESSEEVVKIATAFTALNFTVVAGAAAPTAMSMLAAEPIFLLDKPAPPTSSDKTAQKAAEKELKTYRAEKEAYKVRLGEWQFQKAVAHMKDIATATTAVGSANTLQNVVRDEAYKAWIQTCYSLAVIEGDGFQPWVYKLWTIIKASLGEQIRAQVSSVRGGDLLALLAMLRMAVNQVEDIAPHTMRARLWQSSMQAEGANDVLTYMTYCDATAKRLKTANEPMADKDLQSIFVAGLCDKHGEIFWEILAAHERAPAASFEDLCRTVKSFISRSTVADRLAALKHKPTSMGSSFPLAVQNPMSPNTKMDVVLATVGKLAGIIGGKQEGKSKAAAKAASDLKLPCYLHQQLSGSCNRENCRFGPQGHSSGAVGRSVGRDEAKGQGVCSVHGPGHSDAQCKSKKNPNRPGGQNKQGAAADQRGDAIQKLLLQLSGNSGSYGADFSCVIIHLPAHAFSVGPEFAVHKEVILIDNCANIHCASDMSMAVPGTIEEVSGVVTGCGRAKVTHHFTACVEDFEDPLNPSAPSRIVELKKVHFIEGLAFRLIVSQSILIGSKARLNYSLLSEANEELGLRAVSQERFLQDSGQHVMTARTHPRTGLMQACLRQKIDKQTNAKIAVPAIKYDGKQLQKVELDRRPISMRPQSGLVAQDAVGVEPEEGTIEVKLPNARQTALSIARDTELLIGLHVKFQHKTSFAGWANLLGIALPPNLKCLLCFTGDPRAAPVTPSTVYWNYKRSEAFSVDWVPISPTSHEGYNGYFMIADVSTRMIRHIFAEGQRAWCAIWRVFVALVEAHERNQRAIKKLTADQALCFERCGTCAQFCEEKGIQQVFSAVENQWMNPVETLGRKSKQVATVLMIAGGLDEHDDKLWPEAISAAECAGNALPNMSSTKKAKEPSPLELWEGVQIPFEVIMLWFYPFCSLMLAHKPVKERGGFITKTTINAFLWHNRLYKSHRLYNIETRTIEHRAANECTSFPAVQPLRSKSVRSELLGQSIPTMSLGSGFYPKPPVTIAQEVLGGQVSDINVPERVMARRSSRAWCPSRGALDNIANAAAYTDADAQAPLQLWVLQDEHAPLAPSKLPVVARALDFLFTVTDSIHETKHDSNCFSDQEIQDRTPRTIWDALEGPDKEQWRSRIIEHYDMLKRKGCFGASFSQRPEGRVFQVPLMLKIKKAPTPIHRTAEIPAAIFKPRALIRGDYFKEGVEFSKDEISAKQVRPESIKILFGYAVNTGKIPLSLDCPDAFYGTQMFPRGIIVEAPPGFDPDSKELRPKDAPKIFLEVIATLPGCPQGTLLFQNRFCTEVKRAGWISDPSDDLVFKKQLPFQKKPDIFSTHVDDLQFITDVCLTALRIFLGDTKDGIGREFPGITCSHMKTHLGCEIDCVYTETERSIFMTNTRMLQGLLDRKGHDKKRGARTPMVPGAVISKKDCPTEDEAIAMMRKGMRRVDFQSDLGTANYAGYLTRADAKFALRLMAKVMSNPGEVHFKHLEHLLKWLKSTIDYGVEFVHTPKSPLIPDVASYSDSSHNDCPDTSGSTQGYAVALAKTVISTSSKMSKSACANIQLSEQGALDSSVVQDVPPGQVSDGISAASQAKMCDFMALNGGAKTVIWIKKFIQWIYETPSVPATCFLDNNGVRSVLGGVVHWEANKHVLHAIRLSADLLKDNGIKVARVDTEKNISNPLTKQVACVEQSEKELLALAAPRGKSPLITYGDSTKFVVEDRVVFSTKTAGPIVLPIFFESEPGSAADAMTDSDEESGPVPLHVFYGRPYDPDYAQRIANGTVVFNFEQLLRANPDRPAAVAEEPRPGEAKDAILGGHAIVDNVGAASLVISINESSHFDLNRHQLPTLTSTQNSANTPSKAENGV